MATSREYAYYIKGDKISLAEKDWQYGDGQTLSQPGLNDVGSTGLFLWKSPVSAITDGMEVEYTYSPIYGFDTTAKHTGLTFSIQDNGGIGYFSFKISGNVTTDIVANNKILIRNSESYNGVHEVLSTSYSYETEYSVIITKTRGENIVATDADSTGEVYYKINALNDENDELRINSYLQKAVVDYLKARLAEDQMNIEAKEYFMREFRYKLEKFNDSRTTGPRVVMPTKNAIR